jgi:hypothetical protein
VLARGWLLEVDVVAGVGDLDHLDVRASPPLAIACASSAGMIPPLERMTSLGQRTRSQSGHSDRPTTAARMRLRT